MLVNGVPDVNLHLAGWDWFEVVSLPLGVKLVPTISVYFKEMPSAFQISMFFPIVEIMIKS